MGSENPAAPKQTARGSTGTRCQRVGGSELVPSLALFKHIYTANAPELPNRTWVCFRYVLPELPGRWNRSACLVDRDGAGEGEQRDARSAHAGALWSLMEPYGICTACPLPA